MDYFIIVDPDQRTLSVPESETVFGVYGDNNAERKYFKCQRYVGDNIDLSSCHIFVNYISAATKIGQIECDVADPTEDDNVIFSWRITRNVIDKNESTKVFFAVQAKNADGDTVFTTRKAEGLIYESIEGTETVQEEYADVILQLLSRMDKVEENIGVEVEKYFEQHPAATTEYVDEKVKNVSDNVSEIKEDLVSERTEQLFYYKSSTPIKYYIDKKEKKLLSNDLCLSVIVPISVDKKTILHIKKSASSKFMIALYTTDDPLNSEYSRCLEYSESKECEITIDENTKYIAIWYHYDTGGINEDCDKILKSISISTKRLQFYTPYRAPVGYSERRDCLSILNETDSVILYSRYSTENKANDKIYVNDYIYKKGFVKNVKIRINGTTESTVEVYLIKEYDNVIIRNYSVTGIGELLVTVNEYIGQDFYVAVGGTNSSFASFKYGEMPINFYTFDHATYKEGDIIPISFNKRSDTDTVYSNAHQVIYASLRETVYNERKIVTHNNMFAVGDSITAGHNSYREGEHWWECVAREYNYKVTPGGRSGAGMVYNNGTCGVLQARNTNFKKYNVAVFAFGTNDYGNDYNLGSFSDAYVDDNNTSSFYAGVKEIIRLVKTSNQFCTLVFSLPINRRRGTIENKWAYGTPNNAGHTLNDYCNAIVECCNYYGIPYIDHRNGAFDSYSLSELLYDGLHPNVDGYKILGQEMAAKLGTIIKPYVEYNGVGGIGKW